jgi:threonine synthase
MPEPSAHVSLECLDCGAPSAYHPLEMLCPHCGGAWRQARYDLASLRRSLLASLPGRPDGLWRYFELLPVNPPPLDLSLGEGGTPLIHARNLGAMLGLDHLYIKDERQGPTGSFKDRQAAVSVAVLAEHGEKNAVIASTGNVALAYSAYCARAGIRLWAFLTSLVPAVKMHEVALYGTQVVKVTASYDQAKLLAARFAEQRGWYLDRGARSIAAVEGMKTIAYEIAEQLGRVQAARRPGDMHLPAWSAPDWYVQAVSGGIGPLAVHKGFEELGSLGLTDRLPALAAIQTAGCAPMVEAWRQDRPQAEPVVTPRSHIFTLSTGDPGRSYSLLYEKVKSAGKGSFESVTDEEAFRAMHMVARMEGLSIEPAAGVAFAGLFNLAHSGIFQRQSVVVVNCSGHTMPVERQRLARGWARDVDWDPKGQDHSPEDGLLEALARLDRSEVQHVMIIDDHAEARRLIRRILQVHAEYRIEEASSGAEALEAMQTSRPDLIILDLMMPAMDGFAVLDRLKQIPHTQEIPIIVVTAKELTPAEKRALKGQITRLMTKGNLVADDLLDEVQRAME